jgi:hypothetical protein
MKVKIAARIAINGLIKLYIALDEFADSEDPRGYIEKRSGAQKEIRKTQNTQTRATIKQRKAEIFPFLSQNRLTIK